MNQMDENQEIGTDDVSSIYPLDTNEIYYNYSPKNGAKTNMIV